MVPPQVSVSSLGVKTGVHNLAFHLIPTLLSINYLPNFGAFNLFLWKHDSRFQLCDTTTGTPSFWMTCPKATPKKRTWWPISLTLSMLNSLCLEPFPSMRLCIYPGGHSIEDRVQHKPSKWPHYQNLLFNQDWLHSEWPSAALFNTFRL